MEVLLVSLPLCHLGGHLGGHLPLACMLVDIDTWVP